MDLTVVYEDKELLIIHKPAGVATQSGRIGEKDLQSMVMSYLGGSASYAALINRLDQPVEGLVLFAKTPQSAKILSEQLTSGTIHKYYLAGCNCAEMEINGNDIGGDVWFDREDYLLQSRKDNSSSIVQKGTSGAKRAFLQYRYMERKDNCVLIEVFLHTGRHHQIRVQMSACGLPLLGDRKYGAGKTGSAEQNYEGKGIALCAYRLELVHPKTKKEMNFSILPQGEWYRQFRGN